MLSSVLCWEYILEMYNLPEPPSSEKCWDGNAVFIIVIIIIIFMIVVYLQANFYIKNRGGFAPLHLCCQNGHNETCRVLLLNGCKPDIKNNVSEFIEKKKWLLINSLQCCSMGTPRCTRRRGTGTPGWLGFWSARDVMPLSRTRWGQSPNSYHASFSNHFSVGGNYLDTFFCPEKLGFSKLPFRLTQIGGMAVGSCAEPINSPLLLLLLFWREITEGGSCKREKGPSVILTLRLGWVGWVMAPIDYSATLLAP